MPSPLVIPDLWSLADRADTLPWQPFRPGVEIHRLYGDGSGPSAALLRYAPGAQVPHHDHMAMSIFSCYRGRSAIATSPIQQVRW